MNETDDYDFGSSENSNLSSLFGKEPSFEIGNSSLVYKAPQQPVSGTKESKAPAPSKCYYKYIQLYEIVGDNRQKLGQYILGLVKSEMLIYQSKKNILIRQHIKVNPIFTYTPENFCLTLIANDKKWLLKFNDNGDYKDFYSEFIKQGGIIENSASNQPVTQVSEPKNIPVLNPASVLSKLGDSESISSILDVNIGNESPLDDSSNEDGERKLEKEDILARLAKMGLPQLPSLTKEPQRLEKSSNQDVKEITLKNSVRDKTEKEYCLETDQKIAIVRNGTEPVISSSISRELDEPHALACSIDQIELFHRNKQMDPVTWMMAENRINNAELRQQISLLTSKINEITNTEKSGCNTEDQLKSKLRSFKIKSENLEAELARSQRNCSKLQSANAELSSKLENLKSKNELQERIHKTESSSQTSNILTENSVYKTHFKELLNVIGCLPLKATEFDITQLKNIKENVKDEELSAKFDSVINLLQEKGDQQKNQLNSHLDEMRSNFIQETKRVMINMYSNIGSSFSENKDMKDLLADHVKNATSHIIRIYDSLVENNVKQNI